MKKKFLKLSLLLFSGLLSGGVGIYAYGCADGWWGFAETSSFTPEAFADSSYAPMFYEPYEKFYNYAELDYISKYNDEIVAD